MQYNDKSFQSEIKSIVKHVRAKNAMTPYRPLVAPPLWRCDPAEMVPEAETVAALEPIVALGIGAFAPLLASATLDNSANPTDAGEYLKTEYTFFCRCTHQSASQNGKNKRRGSLLLTRNVSPTIHEGVELLDDDESSKNAPRHVFRVSLVNSKSAGLIGQLRFPPNERTTVTSVSQAISGSETPSGSIRIDKALTIGIIAFKVSSPRLRSGNLRKNLGDVARRPTNEGGSGIDSCVCCFSRRGVY